MIFIEKKEELHKDHRQRMMKKYFENGIDFFENHEILEILLFNIFTRCNTNDISHRLLNEFKSIKSVLNASIGELTSIKGVGESAALRIRFLGDFFKYLARESVESVELNNNELVFKYCKELLDISSKEFFMILFLDKKNTLVSKYYVEGHFNFVTPDKRGITRVIVEDCVSAVAVHNHLAGSAVASSADIKSTCLLKSFLNVLDVTLNDHLVLCNGKYTSMKKEDRYRHEIW